VQLDGDFADAEIERDLLVEAALDDFAQDFAFARRQLCVAVDVLFDEEQYAGAGVDVADAGCGLASAE